MFIWDVEADVWSRGPDMITARTLTMATVYNNKIYVIGGSGGADSNTAVGPNPPFQCLISIPISIDQHRTLTHKTCISFEIGGVVQRPDQRVASGNFPARLTMAITGRGTCWRWPDICRGGEQ
eukprot:COSAG05_NODE_11_length_38500_cov_831.349861_24_plen_123_part_00